MQFQQFPLVRIILCFGAGIICQHYLPDLFRLPLGFSLVLFGAMVVINYYWSSRFNLLFGLLSVLLIFQLGVYQLSRTKARDVDNIASINAQQIKKFKALLAEPPVRKEKSYQLKVNVYELTTDDHVVPTDFKAILYGDTIVSATLSAGDLIQVNSGLERTRPPVNPHSFDYSKYLVYQGVFFQHYVGHDLAKIGHKKEAKYSQVIDKARNYGLSVFDELITDQKAVQVAKALVLGERDALENDVISAYSASGAMHVLAVSGLHVGLIYLLLSSVLNRIPFSARNKNAAIAVISILVLFSYAVLTGLSPSVFRAFVMFSFFALAKAINRPTNTYNILAASALVLLIYDPYLLFSVGFQLSYLAVVGIIYLQPKLYAFFEFRTWLGDKIWSITCVSIAAQLATAPLSMLYFHQFPSYFLVSNLFVIPAAFLILLLGLAMLLFYPLSMLSSLLAKLLSAIIQFTNFLVFELSQWWGGTVQNIHLSVLETWLIYGLTISLLVLFFHKKFRAIYVALACSLAFAGSQIFQRLAVTNSKELMVYFIPGHRAVEFRMGSSSSVLMDEALLMDEEAVLFNISPNHRWNHIKGSLELASTKQGASTLVVFNGKSALILDKAFDDYSELSGMSWDLAVVSHPKQIEMFKAAEFVLNSSYRLPQIMDSTVHVMSKDGYYSSLWK